VLAEVSSSDATYRMVFFRPPISAVAVQARSRRPPTAAGCPRWRYQDSSNMGDWSRRLLIPQKGEVEATFCSAERAVLPGNH
jgi:hypothetical protein